MSYSYLESTVPAAACEVAISVGSAGHHQIACLLIPERGRLAPLMATDAPLSSTQMWLATGDLHSLCVQASTVLYLPGRKPVQGFCPVAQCKLNLTE
jgi:hypothetical protein